MRNARSQIEALVVRDAEPYAPAAIYAADVGGFAIGHDFLVSGFDHAPGDAAGEPTGAAPPVPAVALGSEPAATDLRSRLGAEEAARLVGSGGTPSVVDIESLDVTELARTLAALPVAVHVPTSALSPRAQLGTAAAPQITVLTDGGETLGEVDGFGVLIAPAGLRVRGQLTFRGLVLVLGDVVLDGDGPVRIDGSMWIAAVNALVSLGGSGAVSCNRKALGTLDGWQMGILPHAPVVAGWREVF